MLYRMCWRHWWGTGVWEGCGPWRKGRVAKRQIEQSVRFGNAHHGADSHWLETAN